MARHSTYFGLLVSASNDHTTRFWVRERPGALPPSLHLAVPSLLPQASTMTHLSFPALVGPLPLREQAQQGGAPPVSCMQGMQGDVGPGVDDTVHGFGGNEVSWVGG